MKLIISTHFYFLSKIVKAFLLIKCHAKGLTSSNFISRGSGGQPVLQGGSQYGIWMSILRKYDNSFERTILDRKVPHFRYHNFNLNTKN